MSNIDTSTWKEFRLGDLFESSNGDVDIQKSHINGTGIPVVSAGEMDMGIIGRSDFSARIFSANTITVDMFGNAYFRDFEYKMVTHARVFSLNLKDGELTKEAGLFLAATISKFKEIFSFNNMCSWNKIKDFKILLPAKEIEEIDFEYMEARIKELEEARIMELEEMRIKEFEEALRIMGLDNTKLSEVEAKTLSLIPPTKEFAIGELFDVNSSKKKFNACNVKFATKGFPYVVRTSANNGIRGYLNEDIKYLNDAKTISFGQDTATMFYQNEPYFTGDKIKVLKFKNGELDEGCAQYFLTAMRKSFSDFSWGVSSFNEDIIKNVVVLLPVDKQEKIDFDYMRTYIKALQKLTIQKLYDDKGLLIATAKKIV